jgi:hypothetical protein
VKCRKPVARLGGSESGFRHCPWPMFLKVLALLPDRRPRASDSRHQLEQWACPSWRGNSLGASLLDGPHLSRTPLGEGRQRLR